jgi:hypothetical protein
MYNMVDLKALVLALYMTTEPLPLQLCSYWLDLVMLLLMMMMKWCL